MKVILKRNKVKCFHCNSILEYKPEDLEEKEDIYDKRTGYYLRCPVCKGTFEVSYLRY